MDVHFPCGFGDKVYYITGIYGTLIGEAIVEELRTSKYNTSFGVYDKSYFFVLESEEVYFTKEEAKKALEAKRLSKNEENNNYGI